MKKNILRKDFIIEIKKTMGRFVSIFFIVALGVAFYSGIRASEPSMRITADQYFDDSELMDLKVMGTMGLTKADIKSIGKVSGIEAVEGGYSKDVLCPVGDNEKVVHMLSMQKNFNQVSVVKGRLPEKAGECLVDEDFLSYTDLKVGDTVTFHSGDGEALTDSLVTDTYKIVGIGNSPLYISFGRGSSTIGTGEISGFVVVDKASFDMDVYTEAYVKVSGAEEKTAFTDEYNNLSDAAKEAVSAIEEERCAVRKQEIVDEANEKLADSEKTVNEKSQELEDAKKELESGKSKAAEELEKAKQQLMDGEAELADAKQQIADAKAEIKKIENPKWYVQTREDALTEYQGYGDNADRMRSIGKVFPVLFFLVAALISLTTMTRMVEEQRVQIGTMKALGYGKAAIAGKYIGYALIATLGGSIFGVLAGEKILPFIIIYAYMILYKHLPAILVPYHMSYALQASGIAVACTLIATIASCYKELAAEPAELMRPAAPKQGKRILLERIGIIWKHLNFTWKSTVRNLIRYKKRFFMTIFGIGGCMALMVVGFGLKDCIYEIVSLQYEKVQFYDAATYMSDDISEENRQQLHDYLDQNADIKETIEARMQKTDVKSASGKKTLYLMVPSDNEKIEDFLSFHSRTNKDEVYSLKKDEVILTEKMASLLNVKVGDELTIEDEDRGDQTVTVGAICENYMSHYLYLSPEKYEELYGVPAEYNTIIYSVKDGKDDQIEKIGTKLLSMDGVLNVSYTSSIEGRLDDMLRSLNLVIVVLIVSAGMLAFVVLYNLNNINITERQRELATLKVLGFYDGEVASYVYRENILLTIIGSVVGMVLGNLLHRYIILTVEVEEAMFGRQIHWQSYLYSFLFTVAFSLFVNWVMFYKLKKIDMVESLKSVE
mgnify:CR=1 FL=1